MLALLIIAAAWVVLQRQLAAFTTGTARPSAGGFAPKRPNAQLTQLIAYADRLYVERKWNAAEKAYLGVLKLDHKNITAYVHLGIIYSTQKNMPDAIECFAVAARLRPSGSTQQNLALAYYDNRNYIKAIAAYEKAIMFEPTGQRYIGLGKSQLKLRNVPAAVTAFEKAAGLDPSKPVLQRLAEAYDEAGQKHQAEAAYHRIHELDPTDRTAARRLGIHLPG